MPGKAASPELIADVIALREAGFTVATIADRTGIYAGIRPCQWATADGVIGRSQTPGRVWAWQTRSWSNGQIFPHAVLYQRIIDTASNPGPVVGGIRVDVNDVLAQDCGQWNFHP